MEKFELFLFKKGGKRHLLEPTTIHTHTKTSLDAVMYSLGHCGDFKRIAQHTEMSLYMSYQTVMMGKNVINSGHVMDVDMGVRPASHGTAGKNV